MNICHPLPGEHLWSTLARSIKWSGLDTNFSLVKSLRLNSCQITPSRGHCEKLSQIAEHDSFKDALLSGSSFLLWMLNFDNPDTGWGELKSNHLYKARESQVNLNSEWRYCPHCAKADLAKYGTAYWHNQHNLPFVTHCLRHSAPLVHVPNMKRVTDLSMPNRLKIGSLPQLEIGMEFLDWSKFIVSIYEAIKEDISSIERLRNKFWNKIDSMPDSLSARKPYFDKLLIELEDTVPLSLLKHCFQFYSDPNRNKANILYTTYKRDGISIRHPVFMLVILFWLHLEGNNVLAL